MPEAVVVKVAGAPGQRLFKLDKEEAEAGVRTLNVAQLVTLVQAPLTMTQ